MVVIDKIKKTVTTNIPAFNPASQVVNNKGDHFEFIYSKNLNRLCVKGNQEAYRNSYEYDPKDYPQFCFTYGAEGFESDPW